MTGRSALPILAALAAAALAVPQSASAQCRLCATPTTQAEPPAEDVRPIRLEVRTDLDFDRLILLGGGTGSAILNPDGTRSAFGALGAVSVRAMVGEIVIRGEPGRAVAVTLPKAIELAGLKGGAIRIEALVSDLPAFPELDGAGELKVRIGGELKVLGEVDGDFRGDVAVTVDYL